jgi:AcrR family transcriptional regulator
MKKSRKRSDGLETIERVLKVATAELERHGSTDFNLDRVIEKSEVSRSSIYHHFGNRAGLIAALETKNAISSQLVEMQLMRDFILQAKDTQEVLGAIEFALLADGVSSSQLRRLRRADRIVASAKSKVMQKSLVEAQIEGTRHLTETLEAARNRGLINPALPLDGISYWIQSLLLGRLVVDMGANQVQEKEWVQTVMATLSHVLKPG